MENLYAHLFNTLILPIIAILVLILNIITTYFSKQETKKEKQGVLKKTKYQIIVCIIIVVISIILNYPVIQDMVENKTLTVIGTVTRLDNGTRGVNYCVYVSCSTNKDYLWCTTAMVYNDIINEGETYEIEYYQNSGVIKNVTPISS